MDYPVVERAYEAMVQRGIERLLEHIPAGDLAIQWDETASRHLDDFGVSMYCGFGRQPGEDGQETMRAHRDTVTSVRTG